MIDVRVAGPYDRIGGTLDTVRPRHARSELPRPGGSTPRAVLAAALSAVVPGVGQLSVGRVRRALPFLAVSLLLAAGAVWALRLGRTRVLELLVQPQWLAGALAVVVLSGLVRAAAALDAYCVERRPWRRPPGSAVVGGLALALVLAVVAVPHLEVARAVWAQRELVTEVFQAQAPTPVEPELAPLAPAPGPPEPGGSPRATPHPTQPTPSAVATGEPELSGPWGRDGRFTVLLLGSDAGPGRVGARTDTMVALSVDVAAGTALMIGVPRNLARVPFVRGVMSQRFPHGFPDIANAVYRYGSEHPGLFPGVVDPGATAVEQAVAAVTGLEIDAWAMVDLAGVVGVVRALGGLTLDVPVPVRDRLSPYEPGGPLVSADIPAGRQHLTPDEVYVYVRTRHADSDYSRMRRQRCVLEAMGTELTGPSLLATYPDVAGEIRRNVSTDIARSSLPALVELGARLRPARVSTLLLVPPLVDTSRPDYPRIREVVGHALRGRLPGGGTAAARLTDACS